MRAFAPIHVVTLKCTAHVQGAYSANGIYLFDSKEATGQIARVIQRWKWFHVLSAWSLFSAQPPPTMIPLSGSYITTHNYTSELHGTYFFILVSLIGVSQWGTPFMNFYDT